MEKEKQQEQEQTEQEQQETQRQTVTIDDVVYFRDSLRPEDEMLLQNILAVQEDLNKAQRSVDIINIAKEALVTKLAQAAENFEKIA